MTYVLVFKNLLKPHQRLIKIVKDLNGEVPLPECYKLKEIYAQKQFDSLVNQLYK